MPLAAERMGFMGKQSPGARGAPGDDYRIPMTQASLAVRGKWYDDGSVMKQNKSAIFCSALSIFLSAYAMAEEAKPHRKNPSFREVR